MRILPVLDLQHGVVVRGVAGNRSEYRPIRSRLCDDPSVRSVARGLKSAFGLHECYVADLDAVAGSRANLPAYDDIVDAGFTPWIDAGAGDVERAAELARYLDARGSAGRIIVGLESLADVATLRAIVAAVGARCVVFSLDLKHGLPLVGCPAWEAMSPETIAAQAIDVGVRSLIVLDLSGVGVGRGVPTVDLCRRIRARFPTLELITGGGVRDQEDLRMLRTAGCDAALVATALHDGSLAPRMLTFETRNG